MSAHERPVEGGPPRSLLLREATAGLEIARLFVRLPELRSLPRGRGESVVVLPGFGASDASTWVLRTMLRSLGYRASGWDLGLNTGDVPALLEEMTHRVSARAREEGAPIRLVGWSLGGYLAREVARDRPGDVDRVVTMGSPVIGGPRYTAAAAAYRARGVDLDEIEAEVAAREETPLETPVTAIYSKNDGVVDWRACIDRYNDCVEHVEVEATHVGLGFAPEVLEIFARRLAQ